jgi:ATP-dependent Lon protease
MSLPVDERRKLLQEELRLSKKMGEDVPLKFRIIKKDTKDEIKSYALKLLSSYEDDPENNANNIRIIESLLTIEWNKSIELSVNLNSGYEQIANFLNDTYVRLDSKIYGNVKAKYEIVEILSNIIVKPESKTNRVIGLHGPPGVGKTTLVKNCLSKAVGLPIYSIALGGAKDSTFLTGSLPVYKGSMWGKLADVLITTKCKNPIIYFDELDKLSQSEHGDEIQEFLIHLTDPAHNAEIYDRNLGVHLDFSEALMIFTYNDPHPIRHELLDRIKIIEMDNLNAEDKITIMRDYKLPKILEEINLTTSDIVFSDKIISYINNMIEKQQGKTPGVRNLIRAYNTLVSRILVNILTNKDSYNYIVGNEEKSSRKKEVALYKNKYSININLPYTVKESDVKLLLS